MHCGTEINSSDFGATVTLYFGSGHGGMKYAGNTVKGAGIEYSMSCIDFLVWFVSPIDVCDVHTHHFNGHFPNKPRLAASRWTHSPLVPVGPAKTLHYPLCAVAYWYTHLLLI